MSVHVTKNGTRPRRAPRDLSPRSRRTLMTFKDLAVSVCRHERERRAYD